MYGIGSPKGMGVCQCCWCDTDWEAVIGVDLETKLGKYHVWLLVFANVSEYGWRANYNSCRRFCIRCCDIVNLLQGFIHSTWAPTSSWEKTRDFVRSMQVQSIPLLCIFNAPDSRPPPTIPKAEKKHDCASMLKSSFFQKKTRAEVKSN